MADQTPAGVGVRLFRDDDAHGKLLLKNIQAIEQLEKLGQKTINLSLAEWRAFLLEKLGLWQLKAERRRLDELVGMMPMPSLTLPTARSWKDPQREKPALNSYEVVGLTIHDELVTVMWDGEDWSDDQRSYKIRAWLDPRPYPPKKEARDGEPAGD